MVTRLLDLVGGLSPPLLVLAGLLLSLGESALLLDFIVPGEAGAAIVGAAGERAEVALPLLIAAVAIGALIGDSIGFLIGRKVGTSVFDKWSFTRRRLSPKLDRASDYVERHGGRAVFAGRWIGALRALVPVVAGHSGMSYRRFIAWDVPAAITWASTIVSAGWIFGDKAAELIDAAGIWVLVAVVVVGVVWWLVRRHKKGDDAGHERGGRKSDERDADEADDAAPAAR